MLVPLKNKIHWISELVNKDYIRYRQKDIFFVSDIKSAYKWYKQYRDNPFLFIEEYPEYESKVFSIFEFTENSSKEFRNEYIQNGFDSSFWLMYERWLLDMALYDIIEKIEAE